MKARTYAGAAVELDWLRSGPYRIVKAHIEARRYRVVVLDMRRPSGDRQVWWAKGEGWKFLHRDAARDWIRAQQESA